MTTQEPAGAQPSSAPRSPSAAVLLGWVLGAAAFGYGSMELLQQLGPIRSTATQIPGLVSAWFLGRRFAWLPTLAAMVMIPLLSQHVLSGPLPVLSYLLTLALAVSLVTSIGWLSDLRHRLAREVEQRKAAQHELQALNASLEVRVATALQAVREANRKITEHSESLERTVDSRTAELTAAVNELEWLVAVISHDVRAPLRHVNAYAELLRETRLLEPNPEAQGYLDRIVARATDLQQLVERLLVIGRSRFRDQAFELLACRPIAEAALARLNASSVELGPLPSARCDPTLLGEVLANLVDNATRHGQAPVRISGEVLEGQAVMVVEDGGLKPSARLGKPGLGLMICKQLVTRMGGTFELDAGPAQPTRAVIRLPA